MNILNCLRVEPPQKNDDKPYLTAAPAVFFNLCYGEVELPGQILSLGGDEKSFPAGTRVWIVLRANGRILYQTDDQFHIWGDKTLVQHMKNQI